MTVLNVFSINTIDSCERFCETFFNIKAKYQLFTKGLRMQVFPFFLFNRTGWAVYYKKELQI